MTHMVLIDGVRIYCYGFCPLCMDGWSTGFNIWVYFTLVALLGCPKLAFAAYQRLIALS